MISSQYTIKLAGQILPLKFQYKQTTELYRDFIQGSYEGNAAIGVSDREKQFLRIVILYIYGIIE